MSLSRCVITSFSICLSILMGSTSHGSAWTQSLLTASDKSFLSAVRKGNLPKVKRMVTDHPSFLGKDSLEFLGPLHAAARYGRISIANYLLNKGVGVNSKVGSHGLTPLHTAVSFNQKRMVIFLLGKGATVDARRGYDGATPLLIAAVKDHVGVAKILLEYGAEVNARNFMGKTPLFYATSKSVRMVRLLLDWGAKVNLKSDPELDGGRTPLHWAAYWGNGPVVELLLRRGADINAQTVMKRSKLYEADPGNTPLHEAARSGSIEAAKILLKWGANINLPNKDGWKPLDMFPVKIKRELLRYLHRQRSK